MSTTATAVDPELLTLKALAGLHGERPSEARTLLDESGLVVEDFTKSQTQALFVALAGLVREGKPLEILSLAAATAHAAPRELVLEVVSGDNPELAGERVRVVREASRRRQLLEALDGLRALVNGPGSVDTAVGEAERMLRVITSQNAAGPTSLDGSMMGLIDRLEAVQLGKREAVVATGISAYDYVMGGLQPTLNVIGALPSVGKSALIASICRNIAARGQKVGLISLEDEREWLTERIVAEAASVPLFVLATKPLVKLQMDRIMESADGVYALLRNIIVEDSIGMTSGQVVAAARTMIARGCKAVLIDHLGEIRLPERSQRHDLDIVEVLQDLRGVAKAYRVPVVVACHLKRRDGFDKTEEPRLTDFAFSAGIERCARVAVGLYKPDVDGEGKPRPDGDLGVVVLKQTRGPADVNFRLKMNAFAGTVAQTEPSSAMRQEFGHWRDT